MKKIITRKILATLKIKFFTWQKIQEKHWKGGKMKNEKFKKSLTT